MPSSAWTPAAVRPVFRRGRGLPALIAALVVVALTGSIVALAGPVPASDDRLRVMTYNVRFASRTSPGDWPNRLPGMKRVIRGLDPDVLGVQEPVWRQIQDLDRALPEYDWVGMGCLGGTRDGFTAIFYRRDRFDLLGFDHFWLSDTPDVIGSSTWGNRFVRMVTWAKLRDRRDGRAFYHVNTHFDNYSEGARVKSAQLILRRVRGFAPGLPVLLTGDFNAAAAKTMPYAILTGPDAFTDTWRTARRKGPVYGTFGRWKPPVPGGDRIDWILSRGEVDTLWSAIEPYAPDGRYPSDHYPLIADIVLKS